MIAVAVASNVQRRKMPGLMRHRRLHKAGLPCPRHSSRVGCHAFREAMLPGELM